MADNRSASTKMARELARLSLRNRGTIPDDQVQQIKKIHSQQKGDIQLGAKPASAASRVRQGWGGYNALLDRIKKR